MTALDYCYTAGSAELIDELPNGTSPPSAVATGVSLLDAVSELWQIHGLDSANPMTVSASARSVDAISQTFSGTTTVTVTRTP